MQRKLLQQHTFVNKGEVMKYGMRNTRCKRFVVLVGGRISIRPYTALEHVEAYGNTPANPRSNDKNPTQNPQDPEHGQQQ